MTILVAFEDICSAKYVPFRSKRLHNNILIALIVRLVYLLAQQGQVTIGTNFKQALEIDLKQEI